MRGHSVDLRKAALAAYDGGEHTQEAIGNLFGIGTASLRRWLRIRERTGSVNPLPQGGGQTAKIDEQGLDAIRKYVDHQPDLTIQELRDKYNEESHVRVSAPTISRALKRLGLTRKKRLLLQQKQKVREY